MPSKTITLDGSPVKFIAYEDIEGRQRLNVAQPDGGVPPNFTKEQALHAASILKDWARGVDLDLCGEEL